MEICVISGEKLISKNVNLVNTKTGKLIEQVTFETDNKKDLNLLIAIAEKLGIRKQVISQKAEMLKRDKREDLFRIIDACANVSNFGDPSSWQKATRKTSK